MQVRKAPWAVSGFLSCLVGAIALVAPSMAIGQTVDYEESAHYISEVGNRFLIDAPTAYSLPRGAFDLNFQVNAGGALTAATNVGLSEFLMVGFSYGANGVFSQDYPSYNPNVEFSVKWRLTEESKTLPGLALGFSSQGAGPYLDSFNRSTYKPKGFYGVFSKAIAITGYAWELHGGANYSIETADNVAQTDRGINMFGGLSTELRRNLKFAIEYDFGLDDNKSGAPFGRGRGYLNAALKWVYFDNLQIEFTARDLLGNRREAESFERGLRIVYLEYF